MKRTCTVIVLEGLDGVGKTTTANYIALSYSRPERPIIVRSFERDYLQKEFEVVRYAGDEDAKYFVQVAAISLLCRDIVAFPASTVLICDRYIDSVNAYYCALHQTRPPVSSLEFALPEPTLPVLLECSAETRMHRIAARGKAISGRKHKAVTEFSGHIEQYLYNSRPWMILNNETLSIEKCASIIIEEAERLVMETDQ